MSNFPKIAKLQKAHKCQYMPIFQKAPKSHKAPNFQKAPKLKHIMQNFKTVQLVLLTALVIPGDPGLFPSR